MTNKYILFKVPNYIFTKLKHNKITFSPRYLIYILNQEKNYSDR